jgi:ABC-type antimicrobial peptide transport system permease subunit
VLKDARTPASGLSWIRRGLVVTQFAVSVALIIGTVIVSRQVHYLQDRDLGFNKEHLVWFPNNVTIDRNEAFIQELKSVPGVLSASLTSTTFTASNNRGTEVSWPGKLPGQDVFFNFFATSNDIVNTLGLTVKEGRAFSGSFLADTSSVLVNEEAVRKMGLKDPVGQVLDMYSGKATIVGVVKDFHFESLHHPVTPAIFLCRPNWTWNVYVRTDGRDLAATLSGMEKKYKAMAPGFVFDYNFQDKEYERLYRSESQVGTLVNWFAFLAVFISCLGLLGLTAYTVERRKKEIGVRKVLGASSITILAMVSRQFIGLIIIAVVIASVPAYIIMNNWLGNYAYHVELSWWIFLVAGLAAMLLALVTISIQAGRAARMNPVRSLRTE